MASARRRAGRPGGDSSRRSGAAAQTHPVEDFLFDYSKHRPTHLARWHPGHSIRLGGTKDRAGWALCRYADGSA